MVRRRGLLPSRGALGAHAAITIPKPAIFVLTPSIRAQCQELEALTFKIAEALYGTG